MAALALLGLATPSAAGALVVNGTVLGHFVPIEPTRVLDSRVDPDESGTVDPLVPGVINSAQIVTEEDSELLGEVGGAVLNVTLDGPTENMFLTIWAHGAERPESSSLNVKAGETRANLVVVELGDKGQVSFFHNAGSVDIIIDVVGLFTERSGETSIGSNYFPLSPTRGLDSRIDLPGGATAPEKLGPRTSVSVPIAGKYGVPADASAVVMNTTAVGPTEASFFTVSPGGGERPTASNLNFVAGQTIPNLVIVGLGPDGTVDLYNHNGSTDAIFDVVGYFGPIATGFDVSDLDGSDFFSTPPEREYDSREDFSNRDAPLGPGESRDIRVGLESFEAVPLNVTITGATESSFLTVFPAGEERPNASNLNYVAGDTVANAVFAKVGAGGFVTVYNHSGSAHVIIDDFGFFS